MKLINKATRSFLVACLIASIVGGFLCYLFLKKILKHEATEQLLIQKEKVEKYVKLNERLPTNIFSLSDTLWFTHATNPMPCRIKDTTFFTHHEDLTYRQISFGVATPEGYYKVNIRKALFEFEDLTKALLAAFSSLMLLLVGMLIFLNYWLSRSIWKPFYETLALLQTFKIAQKEAISFNTTTISEFQTLQKNLLSLTEQVRREYQSLKSFTENASHELQTPLAVIGSNLELLLQDDNLTVNQMQQITSLIESLGKLSKLNQTLLLLTKIENRQFSDAKVLNFSMILNEKISLLEVWIQHKKLHLTTNITPNVKLQSNEFLVDVLLNNLLGNAIKYNSLEGNLLISLNEDCLSVKNTGNQPSVPTQELFERFKKDSVHSESLGLGLALVKQICDTYHFQVSYVYENGWHCLTIHF